MKTTTLQPKISIVGAGPGDPELLTLKAVRALNAADVVLYDALVNKEILKHVPFNVPKIFVGKRKGKHTYSQEQINQLLVSFAYSYGHVVRLKGGDPFVFGRGAEEIAFAESFNIETHYIPGISSSIGAAGLAGIPVTHRGSSESFWVITGTTKENELSKDVFSAAKTNATVVILMGLSKISEIVSVYKQQGKYKTPIAIIQNGSTLKENHIVGSIYNIEEKAADELIDGPGIIIIGEVVKLHPDFNQEDINFKQNSPIYIDTNSAAADRLEFSKRIAAAEISEKTEIKAGIYKPQFKYLLN